MRSMLLTVSAVALVPVALTGALVMNAHRIENALHKVHEETFADRAAAERGWVGVPAPQWLPADATDIRNLATNDETNAIIRVDSRAALPTACVEAPRKRIPFDTTDWAPGFDRFPDRVERCGVYEVMRVDGGWFGWFSAAEPGRTPSSPR